MIAKWVRKYVEPKPRKGKQHITLNNSKNLNEVEKLKLIIAKQEIEIERLKKGYQVKEAGVNKEYVTLSDVNMKSSKS